MRIYIDTSALCCEFDDLTVEANAIEASAIEHILGLVELGVWDLCNSGILEEEVRLDEWRKRKLSSRAKLRLAQHYIRVPDIRTLAKHWLKIGLSKKDALHLASALALEARWLLTLDGEFIELASQAGSELNLSVVRPSVFLANLKKALE